MLTGVGVQLWADVWPARAPFAPSRVKSGLYLGVPYRAAALAERIKFGEVNWLDAIEFSLNTLEWPGLPGVSGRCIFRLDGGSPSCNGISRPLVGGEGVDLDKGLLLWIEEFEFVGWVNKELRARVRFPSIF